MASVTDVSPREVWTVTDLNGKNHRVWVKALAPTYVVVWPVLDHVGASRPAFRADLDNSEKVTVWPEAEVTASFEALGSRVGRSTGCQKLPTLDNEASLDALDQACRVAWAVADASGFD